MRYHTPPKKPDLELKWHKHFAWLPVRFEYGVEPDHAWLETVIRKKRRSAFFLGMRVYDYRPLEDATVFPSQFGIGKGG